MKITGFKTFLVDAHRANYIFVKLHTDSGIEGLGEGHGGMEREGGGGGARGTGRVPDRQGSVRHRLPDLD